jgi:hypothetical protein
MRHTRSQCTCCKQVFAGTRAFDAHRVGPFTRKQRKRRCLTRREMRLRGMTQNEQGWWMLPAHQPNTDDAPDSTDRSLTA